jgi:hypothetical protein
MKPRLLVTFFFAAISFAVFASPQDFDLKRKRNAIGIVVGAHYWESPWAEVGFSYARSKNGCIFGSYYRATTFSLLYNPLEKNAGAAVSRWSTHFGFIITGLRLSAYTDFENVNVTFQPQAGIGNGVFSLCYSRHVPLFKNEIAGMNVPHELSLRWNIELKEIEKEKWWRPRFARSEK